MIECNECGKFSNHVMPSLDSRENICTKCYCDSVKDANASFMREFAEFLNS